MNQVIKLTKLTPFKYIWEINASQYQYTYKASNSTYFMHSTPMNINHIQTLMTSYS